MITALIIVYVVGFVANLYVLVVGAPDNPTIIQWLAVVLWPITLICFLVAFIQEAIARRK